MSGVRTLIQFVGEAEKEACEEICNKSTSKLEASYDGFFIAEISKADFDYLNTVCNVYLQKICWIPQKTALTFEPSSDPAYYKVLIPFFARVHQAQLQDSQLDVIERLDSVVLDEASCDCYLFYLTPEQVNEMYNLPFVHSITPCPKLYQRNKIVNIIERESEARVYCEFAPNTKPLIENFVASWSARANKPINGGYSKSSLCFFTKVDDLRDMQYLDEMATLPNVREVTGSGRPRLH